MMNVIMCYGLIVVDSIVVATVVVTLPNNEVTFELMVVSSPSSIFAFGSLINFKNVNANAIKQLPVTSANADVNGIAELSGLIFRRHAQKTDTYARYRRMAN